MLRRSSILAALGFASLALIACKSAETDATGGAGGGGGGGSKPVTPCAQADADHCLVDQKACSLDAGKPTCVACDAGKFADEKGGCAPIAGAPMTHDFAEFSTDPGQEVLGLCQSWTLGNETDIWVNTVELEQDEMSHHSNWTFSPESKYPGEDGVWTCKDRGYDQLSAAVAGGVIYAQSTQAVHEVQRFPPGAAVRIPAHSRIIGDVHILNVLGAPVKGHAKLTLYTVPEAEVTHKLTPFHLTYDTLAIPPHASSRFSGECVLDADYTAAVDLPYAPKLYYALPHTHKLGTRFFMNVIGGPLDKTALVDVVGFNGEARGKNYDPPIDLSGSKGLAFGCEFENPTDAVVHWGFGDQEMCEMLGFMEMDAAFESRVDEVNAGADDGVIKTFTGPCSNTMIPWSKKL
ncbi:MAG: hypothetical protein U0414_36465 [Polyangiaceae bacterium]